MKQFVILLIFIISKFTSTKTRLGPDRRNNKADIETTRQIIYNVTNRQTRRSMTIALDDINTGRKTKLNTKNFLHFFMFTMLPSYLGSILNLRSKVNTRRT